jgi:hypothetical protein
MRLILALICSGLAYSQVGSITITDTSGSTQTNRPFSIARVFRDGDIANYPQPRVNGVVVTEYQVDTKNTWGSGNFKFGIISFHASIPANSTISVDFINNTQPCHLGNLATCQAAALSQSGMLASRGGAWTATIAITNGSTQTADARAMIAAGKWSYWLQGPIVTEMIVEDRAGRAYDMGFSLVASTPVLGLHPQFLIRAYPGYTSGVRQSFVLENNWVDRLIDQTYSLAVSNSGGSQYTRSSFTHYGRGRWRKGNDANQIWDGAAPGSVLVNHNLAYIVSTKALPRYDTSLDVDNAAIETSFLASDQGLNFNDDLDLLRDMGATGARAEIGFVHAKQIRAVQEPSATLEKMLFAYADVALFIPAHQRETRTDNYFCGTACTGGNATTLAYGYPISTLGRPSLDTTFQSGNFLGGTGTDDADVVGTVTCCGQTSTTWKWDAAHLPSLTYLPYLVSGDYILYEETLFWALNVTTSNTVGYRNREWGWMSQRPSTRAAAWHLRTVAQAAFIAVDSSPEKELFNTLLNWHDEIWEGVRNIQSGTYPPSTTVCPGYTTTPGDPGPQSGANRNRWCFGRFYGNNNKTNSIKIQDQQQTGACTQNASLDCALVGTMQFAPWMEGYFLIAAGWAREALGKFSYVVDDMGTGLVDSVVLAPPIGWTLAGGNFCYWQLFFQPSTNNYFSSWSALETAAAKGSQSTTLVGSITSSATSLQVTDYTKIAFKPQWTRTGASGAITALDLSGSTVTVTFSTAHGLAVGDTITTSGHTTTGFNRTTTITAAPSSTQISYAFSGTPPASGSYLISAFQTRTPYYRFTLKVGSELIQACGLETNGVVTVGTASSSTCTATANGNRGFDNTTAAAHTAGDSIRAGYDSWPQGNDAAGGYPWIIRAGASFLYGLTTSNSTGAALWNWYDTELVAKWGATVQSASYSSTSSSSMAWQILPRDLATFTITTSGLPSGTVGVAYSQTIGTSGASGAVTCSLVAGILPAGLSLSSACVLSGTPSAVYASSITIRATDASLAYRDASYGLSITSPSVTITLTPTSLPAVNVGASFSQQFSATGGTGPYSYTVINSTLPAGLVMSASGLLTGNPSIGGTYGFTLRATDSLGNTGDLVISNWTISWLPLSITTGATLPGGTIGVAYSQTLGATGGSGAYTWSLTGGTLPAGLALGAAGAITGTPNTPASYSFTAQVASTDGQTASRTFSLLIPAPAGFQTVMKSIRGAGVIVR